MEKTEMLDKFSEIVKAGPDHPKYHLMIELLNIAKQMEESTDDMVVALAEIKTVVRNIEDGIQLLIKNSGASCEKKKPRKIIPPVAI